MTVRGTVRAATDQGAEGRRNPLAFPWPPCDRVPTGAPTEKDVQRTSFLVYNRCSGGGLEQERK